MHMLMLVLMLEVRQHDLPTSTNKTHLLDLVPVVQVLDRHISQHRHSRQGMVPDRLANIRSEQPTAPTNVRESRSTIPYTL
jgi:hypothetical protein